MNKLKVTSQMLVVSHTLLLPKQLVLYQRGLRMLNKNEDLWISYFKFELNYISIIKKRRELLGLSVHDSHSYF